jgi:hypothetical protein
LETLPSPSGDFSRKRAQRSLAITIICIAVSVLICVLSTYSRLPVRAYLGNYDTAFAITAFLPGMYAYHHYNIYRYTKQGMEGEKRVIQFLKSKLSDNYFLINDVEYVNNRGKKENIDHIILGPKGIFVVETKDWSGKVTYKDGIWSVRFPFGRSPSRQASGNAAWVSETIEGKTEPSKIWVEPVVVFSNPAAELETIPPEIGILKLERLVDYIASSSRYNFSVGQLKAIGDAITKRAQSI